LETIVTKEKLLWLFGLRSFSSSFSTLEFFLAILQTYSKRLNTLKNENISTFYISGVHLIGMNDAEETIRFGVSANNDLGMHPDEPF
jgi:hypothetical protein